MRTSEAPLTEVEKSGDERPAASHWYRKRLVAVTATLGVVACGLLGAGVGTATAGTNGQQITYYNHDSYGQCTTGTSQEGTNIRNCTTFTVIGSNKDEGYWWVGPVSITWYKNDHSTVQITCTVPKNQSGDSFSCYEPS